MRIVIVLIVVVIMLYYFFSNKKRNSGIVPDIVPVDAGILDNHIAFFKKLAAPDKIRFEKEVKEFLNEVKITGIKTGLTDIDRVLVAASAVIPVFAFPGSKYPNLTEVLVYGDTFNMDFQSEGNNDRNILGMVGTGYMEGKMILSKPALEEGFSNRSDKRNTAIHEFAHLIDKSDGDTDGVPELLMDKQYVIPWLDLIHTEMEKIKAGDSDIDPYAYTNKSEFFAVAAEYFFERPDLLEEKHPQLFSMMQQIFNPYRKV